MRHVLCMVLALAATATASAQQLHDWPQWRGPRGDGISPETGWNPGALAGGAKVLWNVNIGYGYSNVVIGNCRLYSLGQAREGTAFTCLDAATGAVIWKTVIPQDRFDNPEPHATPVLDGERVYGLGKKGELYCLQSSDGKVLWTRNLDVDLALKGSFYGFVASPVVAGDLVLINASRKGIALNKNTGDLVWETPEEHQSSGKGAEWGSVATPVVGTLNGTMCGLFVDTHALVAVELATGKTLWSWPHGDSAHPTQDPIVFENSVFLEVTFTCAQLTCFPQRTVVRWSGSPLANSLFNPVLMDGYLYGTCWNPTIHGGETDYQWEGLRKKSLPFRCVDWNTGNIVWEKSDMGGVSVTAAGGKLIMLDLSGTLRIAEATPSGYKELAAADVLRGAKRPRTFPTPPAFCDGRIYCRNYAGDLVCVDVSE